MQLYQPSWMWDVRGNRQSSCMLLPFKEEGWVWFIRSSIGSVMAPSYLCHGPPHLETALRPILPTRHDVGTAEDGSWADVEIICRRHSSILRENFIQQHTVERALISSNAWTGAYHNTSLQAPVPLTYFEATRHPRAGSCSLNVFGLRLSGLKLSHVNHIGESLAAK